MHSVPFAWPGPMPPDGTLKSDRIGIIGFSAGGHLASTLGTHYSQKVYEDTDSSDKLSARPDFMALIYPVISFDACSHALWI